MSPLGFKADAPSATPRRPSPFEPRTPTPEQATAMLGVRLTVEATYAALVDLVPACAERTLAMRALEEAAMWANKAIAFGGERYLDTGPGR